ncbi:MAG: fatty acid desaturase family protein [Rhabdochlamydiaceae bacterium]|nr:fatty acid desaturase family protein [Rhabdochlamydiaceae bacterium]
MINKKPQENSINNERVNREDKKILIFEEKIKNKNTKRLIGKIIPYILIPFMAICSIVAIFTDLKFFTWVWCVSQVFLLWIAADFISGIVHWWEDTYGNPNWPIIGKYIVKPNLIHHKEPNKMLEKPYWRRISTSLITGVIIGVIFWLTGLHSWQIFVCLLFAIHGNQIHAMTHRPDHLNGKVIIFLQKTGILQSKKAHRWHHKAPYETNFCVMSDFTNPILNKIEFWKKLERMILKLFKIDVLRSSSTRDGL